MIDNETRLQAAIGAIHNHLHAGNINGAHEACECALSGGEVSQPNITLTYSASITVFASRFNALCVECGINAAFVALLPSVTKRGATSIQIGGEVRACQLVENKFATKSIFQGDH